MPDELDDLNPNPIVAMAMRIRARRDLGATLEGSDAPAAPPTDADVTATLAAFADGLAQGITRLTTILGRGAPKLIRLEKPLRLRLRFREQRVTLDVDVAQELVVVTGLGLDGAYQPVPDAPVPTLMNLSKLSTESGYGEPLTPSALLKLVVQDAELPRPAHLDENGPLRF